MKYLITDSKVHHITIKDKKFELYLSSGKIEQRVKELALAITHDLRGKDPLFLGILNGSYIFASDLMRLIPFDTRIAFIKLASYKGLITTGKVEQLIGLKQNINGENIIIIEDIVDSGQTLEFIINYLMKFKIASLKIVALLFKPGAYQKNINIDYVGFEIPNDFIVGYGLDYDDYGRNYPDIYRMIQ